jgi:hypothetical protein
MKVLCDMFTRSGAILNFVGLLVCSKHNIGDEGYTRKFNNLCLWCVVCDQT